MTLSRCHNFTKNRDDRYGNRQVLETHSREKTMIFNTSIEHNIKVHEAFLNEGLNSYYVDSLMSKEERQ